jgi:RND superfamily putative drug exporter
MFHTLGHFIAHRPLLCIILWSLAAVISGSMVPDRAALNLREPASLLPNDAPVNEAMAAFEAVFPGQIFRSKAVLVFQRSGGLTPIDRQYLSQLTTQLIEMGQGHERLEILSSLSQPQLMPRLESADGEALMILVGMEVNFLTMRAMAVVENLENIARRGLPQDLALEITGDAAIGTEHNLRSAEAFDRTTWVTITAVLVLLALVYRSPLGALVPLVSIGVSVFIALNVLDFLAMAGWAISNAERTFTVVLLFGAGTDYALFWISRYREELSWGRPRHQAACDAMSHVGPAIMASAGTTILGLMMLMCADMVLIHNSGRVLGIVLSISLLAAITLTPAVATLMGSAFFWPGQPNGRSTVGQRAVWPRLASLVIRRPWLVFLGGLSIIGAPALATLDMPIRYDSFGEITSDSSAARGLTLAKAHFSEESLFSTRFLIQSSGLDVSNEESYELAQQLAEQLEAIDEVVDVWHQAAPYGGTELNGVMAAVLQTPLGRTQVAEHYFNREETAFQIEVMQNEPFLSAEAVAVYHHMRRVIEAWAISQFKSNSWALHAVGPTPYSFDVQTVADSDLKRIIVSVVVVIWLIVLFFVRHLALSVFMLLATLITYAAALGMADWFFIHILGQAGIDYKIKILVFVIIVAVGQDYNIFLVTRIRQEERSYDLGQAIERSIVVTGPVISSCGLIMAATLGSIATTGVQLTEQLGFAFAAGILIDTFLVRPVLIPGFYWLTRRRKAERAVADQ